mgnify:CR=1 FL=1
MEIVAPNPYPSVVGPIVVCVIATLIIIGMGVYVSLSDEDERVHNIWVGSMGFLGLCFSVILVVFIVFATIAVSIFVQTTQQQLSVGLQSLDQYGQNMVAQASQVSKTLTGYSNLAQIGKVIYENRPKDGVVSSVG